uniref:uncharacterized protein LOC122609253 n=1 Tax=Erigeron canadensis TaxID=72917 RepID=UPI001CB89B01|nr:uncharacterized protein LOC122609253 [Erigeron canadensis]
MATRWNKNVPRKVNIHVWRLLKDRLPTHFNLWFRGIVNNSLVCPMCFNGIDTITHTMSDCRIAKKVWTSLSKWLDYNLPYQLSGVDLLEHIKTLKAQKKVKDIITTVTYAAWWYIWRYRNEAVFQPTKKRYNVLVDSIIMSSFQWYSSRYKKGHIRWDDWLKSPCLFA